MIVQEKKELFTEKLAAGRRLYFFDVKETKDNQKYLVITEKRSTEGKSERTRVMVFQEHFDAFTESLNKVMEFVKNN
ncbi:MAG: DUF3276 family protein [Elusimicrobiota bacterium]